MTATAEISELTSQLTELIEQLQAGDEVLFAEGNKPVPRLVPAFGQPAPSPSVTPRR